MVRTSWIMLFNEKLGSEEVRSKVNLITEKRPIP